MAAGAAKKPRRVTMGVSTLALFLISHAKQESTKPANQAAVSVRVGVCAAASGTLGLSPCAS